MDKVGFGHEHLGQCIHRFVQPATRGGGEEPEVGAEAASEQVVPLVEPQLGSASS
jgi:hypothetical protein